MPSLISRVASRPNSSTVRPAPTTSSGTVIRTPAGVASARVQPFARDPSTLRSSTRRFYHALVQPLADGDAGQLLVVLVDRVAVAVRYVTTTSAPTWAQVPVTASAPGPV